jgi:diguanylate cyclase (GGDEF)-like protein/PAS domain S-box-containing protein
MLCAGAWAAPAPIDRPSSEISGFIKPIEAPAARIAGGAPPEDLRWQGFDLVNPAQGPINRRLEFESIAAGPFGFLYRGASPNWTAIAAQGEGVTAEMIPGRQGFTADLRLDRQATGTFVLQLQGPGNAGAWRLWQPAAWEQSIAQAMMLRGLFAGALIAAAAWLIGMAVLRFAAAPFWGAATLLGALLLVLGGAGLTQLGQEGLVLAGAAFAAAMLHFVVTTLELYQTRRNMALVCDGLAISALLSGAAAALGLGLMGALAGLLIQVAGLTMAGLIAWDVASGNAKAKGLAAGAVAILFAGAGPALLTPDWRQAMAGWPLILDGAFVLGLLVLAFTATAPRRPPISEEEAAQLTAERKQAKDNEYRYALGLAAAHQGLWDWNLETGALYVSPAVEALLGLTQGALGRSERNWAALIHPEDTKTYETNLNAYKAQGNASFVMETRMRHARGQLRWIQLKASMIAGRRGDPVRCIGVVSDVTDLKNSVAQAPPPDRERVDPVTGLPARSPFLTQLDQVFATVGAAGMPPRGVVMAIDIERVRAVIEGMGEPAGDRFLKDIAARIQEALGPADVLARVGTEEFALLLLPDDYGKTPDTAVMRVRDVLSKAVHVGQQDVFPAASIGAVALGAQHKQGGDALREAEVAMHHAKRGGAGGYEVFKSEMKPRTAERLSLDADLRRALERGQIEIAYQPIVALRQGGVVGFEALMRWRHHQRGLINPMEFVPLAEETGLIVSLGSYMLERACEDLAVWNARRAGAQPLFVSVNVSPRQLFRADFPAEVDAMMRANRIGPGALKLEVTETVVMRDVEKSAAVLNTLKEFGVGLALDDFGTGYSSLSYLHKLPIDALKIDRSFVTTLTTSRDTGAIVNTIMGMARSLNLSVIAEGVESQPEAVKLAQLGCDYAQGFLFGIPMDAAAVTAMLFGSPALPPAQPQRRLK